MIDHMKTLTSVALALVATLMFCTPLWAGWFETRDQEARGLFETGQYDAAAERFDDPYRSGVAAYRAGDYGRAERAFAAVSRDSVAEDARYNRGNALFKLERYRDAADAYEGVLRENRNHEDARHNLALALEMLQSEQDPQTKQKEKDKDEPKQQDEGQKKDSQQKDSEQKKDQSGDQEQEQKDQSGDQQQEDKEQSGDEEGEKEQSGEKQGEQEQSGEKEGDSESGQGSTSGQKGESEEKGQSGDQGEPSDSGSGDQKEDKGKEGSEQAEDDLAGKGEKDQDGRSKGDKDKEKSEGGEKDQADPQDAEGDKSSKKAEQRTEKADQQGDEEAAGKLGDKQDSDGGEEFNADKDKGGADPAETKRDESGGKEEGDNDGAGRRADKTPPPEGIPQEAVEKFDQLGRPKGKEGEGGAPDLASRAQGMTMPSEQLINQWLDRVESNPGGLLQQQFRVEEQRELQRQGRSVFDSRPW